MVQLIKTDTYHGAFTIVCDLIGNSVKTLTGKNLIFCDEKASLMAESMICHKYGGSFNTEVYSFGNFLRAKKKIDGLLTKQGSTMAVRRILSNATLQCFRAGKNSFAPSIIELIFQLKSAKVTPEILLDGANQCAGVLKKKLLDLYTVYSEYEKFLKQNGYDDQNSAISYLPEVIENEQDIIDADVYLVGFSSFTSQAKEVVDRLVKRAKSVTAVLVDGNNAFAYVNEASQAFRSVVKNAGVSLTERTILSEQTKEGKIIVENLFNPLSKADKIQTERIYGLTAKDVNGEIERVAFVIKKAVSEGLKYKDISIAIPDMATYAEQIRTVFSLMDIPYFLDQPKKVDNHPLVLLICAYVEVFRKGAGKKELLALIKNPLWGKPKKFTDCFEKYLVLNGLFYANFFKPFTSPLPNEQETEEFEQFRLLVCSTLKSFNVEKLLEITCAKDRLDGFTSVLSELGEKEEGAVNAQMYQAITSILSEMQTLLSDTKLDYYEYKKVFLSGISSLELSIIPQYNDAVFVGEYREISLAKAKYLFAVGLTSEVPSAQEDVAILSDSDIDALENVKVLVEPKIKIVNHRARESMALALASFSEKLFVSYPVSNKEGDKNGVGEAVEFIAKNFSVQAFPNGNGYYTHKQGLLNFAKSCSRFAEGLDNDFTLASSFYEVADKEKANELLNRSQKELKLRLEKNQGVVLKSVTSPTALEEFNDCPYKAFLSHGLKIKKSDDGLVSGLSVGNLMHDIFAKYLARLGEVKDEASSEALFESVKEQVIGNADFARFLSDPEKRTAIENAVKECEKFCYKNYLWLKNSRFKADSRNLEVKFGDGQRYDAVKLNGGKVKIVGKIDRLDTYGDYFRIIDYKTGSADSSERKLFAGVKLQLYLYASAIKGKKLAGAYYLPVNDNFIEKDKEKPPMLIGKTLDDKEVLHAQDESIRQTGKSEYLPVKISEKKSSGVSDENVMQSLIDYAVKISEKTVKNMREGVIVSSPFVDDEKSACDYCDYKGMCDYNQAPKRTLGAVGEKTILQSIVGGEENE
ncbi:MAG: PD-(D/E)XK nuclease family protein [Clostridia bacterium]|nr:PD-(D/E)XK nuclease family protein [Clostridia bacterium]